ncbi:hypothetical protein DIC66_16225 [Rhodoferax lacus]|uniref:Lipoprotein n=1 Tax=Rhodoferax lacus TaxID=2184758 RepID=A0A3E1RBE5_9BURK|nr:hypothetical protein [Rhodoferax lacus]RFO95990.1 hypothetical protein DIC66_16225 [Rhodoferax lacus]
MAFKSRLGIALVVLGICGCSTRTAYFSAQEMQRAQCDRLTDLQELQRCRAQTHQSYDDYQRQVETVKPTE